MDRAGFEPATPSLQMRCSTAELTAQKLAFGVFTRRLLALGTALPFGRLVRALGIGPRTSVLSGQRSTTELCPQMSQYHSRI